MQKQGTGHEKGSVPISRIRGKPGKHSRNPETRIRNFGPDRRVSETQKTAAGCGRLDGVHEQICVKETCDADPGTDRRDIHGLFHLKPFTR